MDNELYCPMKLTSNPPKKEDADENGYVMAIAGAITKSDCVGYPYKWLWNVVAKHPYAFPVWKLIKEV